MTKFKNLKLGHKFSIFGGIMVLAMVAIMVLSWNSSKTTHRDLASYRDAAEANELFQSMEIDHLKWVNTIEDAMMSNAAEISVETDHRKCNLGHFLYGEERTAMVEEFPELTSILRKLEAPHQHLHESSIPMIEAWRQIHPGLIEDLGAQLDKHRVWAATITTALLDEENPSVEVDPTKCSFGKWLTSEEGVELRKSPLFSGSFSEAEEIHKNMHASVNELIQAQTHEEKKGIYNGPIKEGLHHFVEALSTMIEAEDRLSEAQEEAKHIYHGELTEALEQTQHTLKEAEHIVLEIEEERTEHLDHSLQATLWDIIIGSLLAITFSIIIGLIILRMITRPVIDCEAFALKLAEGDFTQSVAIDQEDEIGRLGKSLNKMVAGLREGFGQIREGVNSLASSTTELSAISSQLASNAERSSEVSTTVAASTEETSQSMTSVAASVEEMSANLQTLATSSAEMKSTINEVAKNTEKGREMTRTAVSLVGSASSKMGELDKAVQLIGNITDTIKGISDQTNLLALNATIEAASAGEAGKGFAVVANEIKELSRQTTQATEQISSSIESIQSSTAVSLQEINGVVEAIEEIDNITSLIASAVEEQSYTTNEIASNVSQTAEGVHEISSNVAQVNEATLAVAEDVSHVRLSSEEIAAASIQLNSSTVEISHFAEELSQIADRYKV